MFNRSAGGGSNSCIAALELVSATTDCILIGLNATASRALPTNNIMVANDSVLRIKFLLFI